MDTIKALLREHVEEISKAKNIQVGIVYKMYDVIKSYLDDIINFNWMGPDSKLALIGGIMINCDGEGTDMFLPLHFEIKTNKG